MKKLATNFGGSGDVLLEKLEQGGLRVTPQRLFSFAELGWQA